MTEHLYNVAVVGATGAVGQQILKLLESRHFPIAELKLLSSARSAGKGLNFKGQAILVEEATPTVLQESISRCSVRAAM